MFKRGGTPNTGIMDGFSNGGGVTDEQLGKGAGMPATFGAGLCVMGCASSSPVAPDRYAPSPQPKDDGSLATRVRRPSFGMSLSTERMPGAFGLAAPDADADHANQR